MRIVSLLPSATEIVAALGRESWLVGRSEECDYPSSVRSLPVVMRARSWDADRPSAEIDLRVQETRGRGESLYILDVPRIKSLSPDLLLTQDLCGVCSVTEDEVRAACAEADVAPRIVSLTPRSLDDVWVSVETIGSAMGEPSRGATLARELRERSRAAPTPDGGSRPRVGVLEWLDPPILAGLWTPDVIHAAGGIASPARSGEPGRRLPWSELIADPPDLLVLSPCSFNIDRTQKEADLPTIARQLDRMSPRFGTWLADEAYFSRPGPRLADGVELIRHLLTRDPWVPTMPVKTWAPVGSPPEATA